MITLNNLMNGKTAFSKAQELKPKTVRIDKDIFIVEGNTGIYKLTINDAALSDTVIDCDCRAGQLNKPCFHAAAVVIAKLIEDGDKRRAEQEAAEAKRQAAEPVHVDFDYSEHYDLNDPEQMNLADMATLPNTPKWNAVKERWFELPREQRATMSFGEFAGI